jgi:hypothetical protein
MRQRIFIALAAVGLLTAIVAGPALAGAGGVQRYQVATTSYTISVLDAFTHIFVVALSPCDDSITVTGSTPVDSGYYTTETVVGTLTNGVIAFSATYDGPYSPGFAWSGSFPVGGGPLSGQYTGTVTAEPTTFSSYKNHGDFVSSMGGGSEAAHSCIGKPIKSDDDTGAPANAKDKAAHQTWLVAMLEALIARLQNAHAIEAIQRHVDRITGNAPALSDDAQTGGKDHPNHPKHPSKPATASSGHDHPNNGNGNNGNGNHSGKPKP